MTSGLGEDFENFLVDLEKLLRYRGTVRQRYVEILKLDVRTIITKHRVDMADAVAAPQLEWAAQRAALKTEIVGWKERCRLLSLRINELRQDVESLVVKLQESQQTREIEAGTTTGGISGLNGSRRRISRE